MFSCCLHCSYLKNLRYAYIQSADVLNDKDSLSMSLYADLPWHEKRRICVVCLHFFDLAIFESWLLLMRDADYRRRIYLRCWRSNEISQMWLWIITVSTLEKGLSFKINQISTLVIAKGRFLCTCTIVRYSDGQWWHWPVYRNEKEDAKCQLAQAF